MRCARFRLLFCFALFNIVCQAQQNPVQQTARVAAQGDQQAVKVLTQSLTAAGGVQAVGSLHDFEGAGTITYFLAGQQISGPATVRSRGSDQFRLDAELPQGARSVVVDRGHTKLSEVQGTHLDIPSIAVSAIGLLTNPYPGIATALNDPRSRIAYMAVGRS